MKVFIKNQIKKILNFLPPQLICRLEFRSQSFSKFNERPVEYGFVFTCLQSLYPQKILDVGTGITSLPHLMSNCGFHVTAIDNITDYWPVGMSNRHYYVINDDITNSKIIDKFDVVTCISVLEHIVNHKDAIKNMFNLLKPNGHLILTIPYSENHYVRNVYEMEGSNAYGKEIPFITQSFSKNELSDWLSIINGKIVKQEYWKFWSEDHWSVGNQLIPPIKVNAEEKHQLSCLLIQKV